MGGVVAQQRAEQLLPQFPNLRDVRDGEQEPVDAEPPAIDDAAPFRAIPGKAQQLRREVQLLAHSVEPIAAPRHRDAPLMVTLQSPDGGLSLFDDDIQRLLGVLADPRYQQADALVPQRQEQLGATGTEPAPQRGGMTSSSRRVPEDTRG